MNGYDEMEQAIFAVATSLEDPALRQEFLDDLCAVKPSRRQRLRHLLELQAHADAFFQETTPALALSAEYLATAIPSTTADPLSIYPVSGEIAGSWIGRYQLVTPIGEGGSGVVWLAEQHDPVRRRVALKVIRHGMDHDEAIARFRMEQQSLASMDHPNIALVLDAGATDAGKPFFVMEWVRGLPITKYCDEQKLNLDQRIKLFIQVCHAIQHAHQKGVIHRDIKPANVLVCSHDGKPIPKVIDFGIAKATYDVADSFYGTTGNENPCFGTPIYMSPEQAKVTDLDVDTRSDVYSLGVLLYELLVGHPPWNPKEFAALGSIKAREFLLKQIPHPPSARLSQFSTEANQSIAFLRSMRPQQIQRSLRGDLDSIVMKALAKNRSLRYDTANGLAQDLLRFLNHEPVIARVASRSDRLRKWMRRNRVAFIAGTIVISTMIIGLGLTTGFYLKEREARQEQARLRIAAEQAGAIEAKLRNEASIRENISRAAVLLSEGDFHTADAVLRKTPISVVAPSRETADVLRSLGEWNALHSRWAQAAECFARLDQANSVENPTRLINGMDLLTPGPCLIESGNLAAYDEFRERILARFGLHPDPQSIEQTIKATMLLPYSKNMAPALQPLDQILTESLATTIPPNERLIMLASWRSWALHLLKFRLGDDEGAIYWADKTAALDSPNLSRDTMIDAVLAMAHHRRGEHALAAAKLVSAREKINKAFTPNLAVMREPMGQTQGYWWDWMIARILFREAEIFLTH